MPYDSATNTSNGSSSSKSSTSAKCVSTNTKFRNDNEIFRRNESAKGIESKNSCCRSIVNSDKFDGLSGSLSGHYNVDSDDSNTDSTSILLPLEGQRERDASNGPERPTQQQSLSFDLPFEVQKGQPNTHAITLVAGENAKSINILYDEIRQMTPTSFGLGENFKDENNNKNVNDLPNNNRDHGAGYTQGQEFGAFSPCSKMQNVLAKRVAVQSRADELIREGRKACSAHHVTSANNRSSQVSEEHCSHDASDGENVDGHLVTDNLTNSDKSISNRGFVPQRIKRAQSLDHVLSTKEILEFATLALEQKEKCKQRRIDARESSLAIEKCYGLFVGKKLENETTLVPARAGPTTEDKEAMLDRQAEKGMCISTEGNKEEDALRRIKSKIFDSNEANNHLLTTSTNNLGSDADTVVPATMGEGKAPNTLSSYLLTGSLDLSMTSSVATLPRPQSQQKQPTAFSIMKFLWGADDDDGDVTGKGILACGPVRSSRDPVGMDRRSPYENKFASMANNLMRQNQVHHERLPSFAETAAQRPTADPRMREWIDGQFALKEEFPNDGTYLLGKSRTVVVHEIIRGNWTWCTAWSPDGCRLAVATENHHLAIIDTSTSVFRVRHDNRINSHVKKGTTHSIRAIAWGHHFIATGGLGDTVSLLA